MWLVTRDSTDYESAESSSSISRVLTLTASLVLSQTVSSEAQHGTLTTANICSGPFISINLGLEGQFMGGEQSDGSTFSRPAVIKETTGREMWGRREVHIVHTEEGRRVCLCPAPLSDCVTSNWGHHAPPSNTAWQKLVATLAQTYLQGNPEGNTSLTDWQTRSSLRRT